MPFWCFPYDSAAGAFDGGVGPDRRGTRARQLVLTPDVYTSPLASDRRTCGMRRCRHGSTVVCRQQTSLSGFGDSVAVPHEAQAKCIDGRHDAATQAVEEALGSGTSAWDVGVSG